MKKMLIIVMALLLTVAAFATTIREIQYTADVSGDSPLKDQVVTVSGIVTGEPYAFGNSKMYIQDGIGPWSGIYVYLATNINNLVDEGVIVAEGDSVTLTGTVDEYYGLSQIKNVTALTVDQVGVGCPKPMLLTADSLQTEAYEGCLIRLENVAINDTMNNYGEWDVEDATDTIAVDDDGNAPYYFWPEDYDSLISITGLMTYSYSERKIIPRLAWDIIEGPFSGETKVYTRIQRIQQVRASDLLKTPTDGLSDFSYLVEEDTTLYIKGVITMPTGLSYAGDGVKFILSDTHGGPWSAILSYNEDASLYPDMFAGDLIEMGGYIGEYSTTPANMTEFWLVGDVNLLGIVDLPDTAVVTTGDLRVPITAEQWGNNIVRIENAIIVDNAPAYEILEIDDGSGSILVDNDSDSLTDYIAPPPMTPIESITGWVYHHYGSYADSSTYKLCPNYEEDIVLGEGPAMLLFPTRLPVNIPTSSQAVVVSVTVSTLRNVDTAKVFYKIDDGSFTSVEMIDLGSNIWSGTIPAQANSAIVEYYYYVVDDSSDVSALPSNYADGKLFTYKVLDGDPTIYDIQYTHAESGLSPLHGCDVTFDAYVTMDGALSANFKDDADKGAITVASAPGAWNGVWVFADPSVLAAFHEGDIVTVAGKVDDDHEAYWAYQTNTYVVGTVTLKINEVPLATTPVTLADLESDPEAYEGVLIEIDDDSEIGSINSYDLTLTDGTYSFLMDDDIVADSILDINYQENAILGNADTLVAGDSLSNVIGVVIFSYGSIKIEVRQVSDVTIIVKVIEPGVADVPNNFILHQNYPNPFNPVTTIRFDLAKATNVKLTIYDLTGRVVENLVNTSMNAGSYDLRWNASHLSSGMYLYRIETPEFTATNKLLLLK
ncbi:MAG: T9SS type A sorting domain-containing protein [Candidatus Marinimicrobia bacterium]|nr:T9SS type A sorting domain-containing protein [Candidatus Neomarinimicrobiota bacterium]